MAAIPVDVRRHQPGLDLEADLQRARALAKLFDARFEVLGVKFGLDALVGLIPGIGDVVGVAAAAFPLHVARKHGLSKWTQRRMAANIGLDFLLGLVPLVGDVADVFFKANLKNVALLEKAVQQRNSGR